MPDTKITALTALTAADPANDVLPIVDVSDTTMAASGTTKKISINNVLGCSGTATLASATITGDLTVDTNTLKVDSANNRVIVGHTSGSSAFQVTNAGAAGLEIQPTGFSSAPLILSYNRSAPAYTQLTLDGSTIVHALSGTTAMTLNSTGLGVGGVPSGLAPVILCEGIAGTYAKFSSKVGAKTWSAGYRSGTLQYEIQEDGTERFVIANGGNVGIGTTPKPWRSGARALQLGANGYVTLHEQANGNPNLCFAAYEGSANVFNYTTTGDLPSRYVLVSGTHQWFTAPSGTAGNAITWTQAMTLDASGNLLIGQTASTNGNLLTGYAFNYNSGASQFFIGHQTGTASGTTYEGYSYNGTLIGSITQNGTTGVLYNITSDYRLKEQVQPLVGGLARVNALKPSVYKWKSDGSNGEGFLAHELAEVVPFAVSGEKDAVNEDGSIKSQGIDMSRVVPILVAAIQELTARVQTLETR